MKKTNLTHIGLFVLANCAWAQTDISPVPRTVSQVLEVWVANTETHLVPLADAMPGEKYSFVPSAGQFKAGRFKDVRTFGEQVKHLAANNYLVASYILGEKPAAEMRNETGPDSAKTKAEVMAYLRGSFVALHKAVATINEQNLVAPMKDVSNGRIKLALETRLGLAIDAMCHSFDHYGQLVEYLRMNGMVPPESRPKG